MSNELRIFRFAPDQPGKGGHSTGFHTFMARQDTRRVEGFRPFQQMWWRDRRCTLLNDNSYSPRKIIGFKEWLYFEAGGTSQKSRTCFADWYDNAGSSVVGMRLVGNQDIYWESGAYAQGRATFVAVKDRLVMATCQGEARIWPGTLNVSTPTNVYRLGVPAPTIAPTITVTFNYTAGQYYYTKENGTTVQYPLVTSDSTWDGLVYGEEVRLTHESLSNPSYVTRKVLERVSGITRSALPNVGPFKFTDTRVAGITFSGTGNSTTGTINHQMPDNGWGVCSDLVGLTIGCSAVERVILNATVSGGTTTITVDSNWPVGGVSGAFYLKGVRVYLDGAVPGNSDTLNDANRKMSRPAAGTGYSSWSGAEAPGYAYAYYDPVSGHVSDLSPITYVSQTDVVNGRLSIDTAPYMFAPAADGVSYTTTAQAQSATGIQYVSSGTGTDYGKRFTKILWFRTRRTGGGAVLYPIGSLDPGSGDWLGTSGNPQWQADPFVDGSTDAQLVVSGRVRAPIGMNYQPSYVSPTGVRTKIVPRGMAWWDGRLWLFGVPDPGALRYSCDNAQAAMGRPEESFPDENRLVIPASDGEITAILTCGEFLIVVTRQFAYKVVGNHESNYRLIRISTEIGGLGVEALQEIPTENGMGGVLAAVTADKRVLIVQIDGQTEEIGAPIMTSLGGAVAGIAFYRANGHARLAVAVSDASGSKTGYLYEYNFTHKTWTQNNPTIVGGNASFSSIEYLGVVLRNGVALGTFLNDTESMLVIGQSGDLAYFSGATTTGSLDSTISTWALPGAPTKRRYSFVWARCVLVGANVHSITPPYFHVRRDGRSSDVRYTFHDQAYPERRLFSGNTGLDGTERELVVLGPEWTLWDGQAATADGKVPWGYNLEFAFVPNGSDSEVYAVAYIDIAIRELSEDGEVDP